jgi:SulP family sulfate permease
VPGSIVAVVLGTLAVALLNIPVETIGSRYGLDAIPRSLPMPAWPDFNWHELGNLIRPAFTIALLGAIESLLCAVVADGMIDDRHDSNQELMAQGIANVSSAVFVGLPATGAIARTATNIRSGARSPVAGMIHAITILVVILAAAPLARYIPLPVLSAVLVNVALNMGEWHNFSRLRQWPRSDTLVFLGTFVLTVLFDITIAVEVGMVLAAFLFIKRVSETTRITQGDSVNFEEPPADSIKGKDIPKGVLVYSVFGAFLFGAAEKIDYAVRRSDQDMQVLILKMRQVLAMDATGLQRLEDIAQGLRRKGKHLVLAGPHSQPLMTMSQGGFIQWLGEENLCENLDTALVRARELLSAQKK